MINLININKIHFIGIGGIGISGLARIMQQLGKKATGSDLVNSEIIAKLKTQSAIIHLGKHLATNLSSDTDLVIHTTAIKASNPEFKKAKKLRITTMSYPQALGELMNNYLPLIVAGTHGKSTTTAMLTRIFIEAGKDPSVIVGTKISECDGSNSRLGLSRYFIVEGDEYREAFLNYQPIGLIINNIEADHLDYYKTEQNVIKAFSKLIKKVPAAGFLVANADDANVLKVIKHAKCRLITFGLGAGDYQATHIVRHGELTRFAVKGLENFDLAIKVPGIHNVQNALAACVLALSFGVKQEITQKALLKYNGAWRRFEIKGESRGVVVIDDYAHHPTEIKATLQTARQVFPNKNIWCVFQPHSIDRTERLFKNFINSFNDCDKLIITEIYRVFGREFGSRISSNKLASAVKKIKKETTFINDYKRVPTFLSNKLKPNDIVITMGAGTITQISDQILQHLSKPSFNFN